MHQKLTNSRGQDSLNQGYQSKNPYETTDR